MSARAPKRSDKAAPVAAEPLTQAPRDDLVAGPVVS